jgi:hypothetical protein
MVSSCDYEYSRYCDAVDELNNDWEKYTDESMYPDIWRFFVNKQTDYLICLDSIHEFVFNDNIQILEDFSKVCKKINWD